MEGRVRALYVTPRRKGTPESVESVETNDHGFEGDYHAETPGRRMILLVSSSVLDALGVPPGALKENVTVDGLDVMALNPGQTLRLGGATVEVTVPCEPCVQMDRVKPGLQHALRDRRGMFVRVVQRGHVRVGDAITA